MRALVVVSILALVAGGCLQTATDPRAAPSTSDAVPPGADVPLRLDAPSTPTFSTPVRVNPPGLFSYEPSIQVDPHGNVYVAAHKSGAEGARGGSAVWWSRDGTQFQDMPGLPATLQPGIEGDLAVDSTGHVHFVDVYGEDAAFARWSTGPEGPTLVQSKSRIGTRPAWDDRPWLAAQGDGTVYYLWNACAPVDKSDCGKPIFGMSSTDGGRTWANEHNFASPSSWFCHVAAVKRNSTTAFVGCPHGADPVSTVVHTTHDAGKTWTMTEVATWDRVPLFKYTSMAADDAGNPFYAWFEDEDVRGSGYVTGLRQDGLPTTLRLARSVRGAWDVLNITPFAGNIDKPWVAAGPAGSLAVTFYATKDNPATPASSWHAYALVTREALEAVPRWSLVQLDPTPSIRDYAPPQDFFQCVMDDKGMLHVAYHRSTDLPEGRARSLTQIRGDILYVRQVG